METIRLINQESIMKYSTHTITRHVLTLDDDREFNLEFEPAQDPLVEAVGNKTVVAYLVRDDDAENPMTASDGQGDIYVSNYYYYCIWHDPAGVRNALCCNETWNDTPNIEKDFTLPDGSTSCLRSMATEQWIYKQPRSTMIEDFMEFEWCLEFDPDGTHDDVFRDFRKEIRAWAYNQDEVEELANDLYAEYWQDMAGPFVVPISYRGIGGGCYSASIAPCGWDGDYSDLPDGVWVADGCAKENLMHKYIAEYAEVRFSEFVHLSTWKDGKKYYGWRNVYKVKGDPSGQLIRDRNLLIHYILRTHGHKFTAELREEAVKYAAGVCKEVEGWMNGDVYGCVVEVFEADGTQLEEDACWGYNGEDYAEECLKGEFFEPKVKRLKEAA